jgi:hypothetical protein
VKHNDFAMACGEMSPAEFQTFLNAALGLTGMHSIDGSIHFVCMHWSKLRETLAATESIYSELKNLCIWSKSNGGMGSLYRSQHEPVLVFKKGFAQHINNIELSRYGRNRSNVWQYPGQNVLNSGSKGKLSIHPTVKPVALVADAIRDCSHRSGIVLDPFGGRRHDADRRGKDAAEGAPDRIGAALRRCDNRPLAAPNRQDRSERGHGRPVWGAKRAWV